MVFDFAYLCKYMYIITKLFGNIKTPRFFATFFPLLKLSKREVESRSEVAQFRNRLLRRDRFDTQFVQSPQVGTFHRYRTAVYDDGDRCAGNRKRSAADIRGFVFHIHT